MANENPNRPWQSPSFPGNNQSEPKVTKQPETEAPRNEGPEYEAPRTEAPGYEAPGTGTPGYGASGYGAPKYAASGYGAPGYGQPNQGYGPGYAPSPYRQPVIKPGTMILRPQTASEIVSTSFGTFRFNARTTFAISSIMALFVFLIEYLVQSAFTDLDMLATRNPWDIFTDYTAFSGQGLANIVVLLATAPLIFVAMEGVLGRKISAQQTVELTRGNRGSYALLAVIAFLIPPLITAASIGVPLLFIEPGLVSLVWFFAISVVLQIAFYLIAIRFMFAFPIILVEGQKVRPALSRSWKLTRERFWPLLGTSLLMGLAMLAIAIAFSAIFGVISGLVIFFESTTLLALITAISTALIVLLITPLSVYALTLMYVDTRIRKEGYDIDLARSRQTEAL